MWCFILISYCTLQNFHPLPSYILIGFFFKKEFKIKFGFGLLCHTAAVPHEAKTVTVFKNKHMLHKVIHGSL